MPEVQKDAQSNGYLLIIKIFYILEMEEQGKKASSN